MRPSFVEVDPTAISRNVEVLRRLVAPAGLWAVVKADGYGHGAVTAARAALVGGAAGLAVALVSEGEQLRAAGIDRPILVLSEPPPDQFGAAQVASLEPTVYSKTAIRAAADAASSDRPMTVHLKVDTGMHRVGCDPDDVVGLAAIIDCQPTLRLGSLWTHCAVADEPENPFTATQLDRFDAALSAVRDAGVDVPAIHMANSAAALVHARSRGSFVRCGISIYGLTPSPAMTPWCAELRPALSLRSAVSHVQRVGVGEGVSYGLRFLADRETTIATVPVGYADGVPRRLGWTGGEVLVGGRRRSIAGTVTMDQVMVECGDDEVAVGDEVVLIGRQGSEQITVSEWAQRLGTITYEVVCGLGARLPRRVKPA